MQLIRELLNYLTLVADALIVLIVLIWLYDKFKFTVKLSRLKVWLDRNFLWPALIVSITATLGSLFFSEIMRYEPCKLCWLQRIFMYPLPLLFILALAKKDRFIRPYALLLSVVGGLLALYHYILQVGQMYFQEIESLINCSNVGYSPSCTSYFFLTFGYITIPMMSLSAFVLLILILSIKSQSERD